MYSDVEIESIIQPYNKEFISGTTIVEMNSQEFTEAISAFGISPLVAPKIEGTSLSRYKENEQGDTYLVNVIVMNKDYPQASENAYLGNIRHELTHYVCRQVDLFEKTDNNDFYNDSVKENVSIKEKLQNNIFKTLKDILGSSYASIDKTGNIITEQTQVKRSQPTQLWNETIAYKFGNLLSSQEIVYKLPTYMKYVVNSNKEFSLEEITHYADLCIQAMTRVEEIMTQNPEKESELFFDCISGPEEILEKYRHPKNDEN